MYSVRINAGSSSCFFVCPQLRRLPLHSECTAGICSGKRLGEVTVVSHNEFDGEFNRNGLFYLAILWTVSLMAAMSNLTKAFLHKIKSPKRRFLEIFWSMGRSKDHISIFAVDAFSRFNHQAKYGAAGWKSLELF